MTTPRDDIGLSERLHAAFIRSGRYLFEEAATQLDALQTERAWLTARANARWRQSVTARNDIATDCYANLISIIADIREKSGLGGKPMLSELADAIGSKLVDAESRATRAQRQRDEAYERAAKVVEDNTISYSETNCLRPRLDGDRQGLEYAAAIRRLAAGDEEGKNS